MQGISSTNTVPSKRVMVPDDCDAIGMRFLTFARFLVLI